MDHTTRNMTIRALAAATAAEIRSRPAKALRAHTNPRSAAISGETTVEATPQPHLSSIICTDRDLPLERTPNHYTGEHRDEVAR